MRHLADREKTTLESPHCMYSFSPLTIKGGQQSANRFERSCSKYLTAKGLDTEVNCAQAPKTENLFSLIAHANGIPTGDGLMSDIIVCNSLL